MAQQRGQRVSHGGEGVVLGTLQVDAGRPEGFLHLIVTRPVPGARLRQVALARRGDRVELLGQALGLPLRLVGQRLPGGPVKGDARTCQPGHGRQTAPFDRRDPFLPGLSDLPCQGVEERQQHQHVPRGVLQLCRAQRT